MKTKLINADQRQRQDYLDIMDKKAIRKEEQHLVAAVCIAGVLTILALALLNLV